MGDGYEVSTSTLDQHEQDIRQIMGQVSGAVDSVRDLFDPQAFGIIGTEWSMGLNAWIQQHTGCIDSAVKAASGVADSVATMSQNYQRNEADVARSFTSISGDMKGE
jgi:hypothetical protein